ncbi:MAG: hypothetical protein HN929_11625 [Chloroflexi bacterium]|jgi:hypothetical protein|nr:hypothetical protein [Chloroflexota bacterium]
MVTLYAVTNSLSANEEMLEESGIRSESWFNGEATVVPQRIGMSGSAAEGDFTADLYAGSKFLGRFDNTQEGAGESIHSDHDMFDIMDAVAVKLKDLKLIAQATPTTNEVIFKIECIGG